MRKSVLILAVLSLLCLSVPAFAADNSQTPESGTVSGSSNVFRTYLIRNDDDTEWSLIFTGGRPWEYEFGIGLYTGVIDEITTGGYFKVNYVLPISKLDEKGTGFASNLLISAGYLEIDEFDDDPNTQGLTLGVAYENEHWFAPHLGVAIRVAGEEDFMENGQNIFRASLGMGLAF